MPVNTNNIVDGLQIEPLSLIIVTEKGKNSGNAVPCSPSHIFPSPGNLLPHVAPILTALVLSIVYSNV